jgi:transposase-like protein
LIENECMASLFAPHFQNEDAAREFLEAQRWPEGPVCPHCGVIGESTKLQPKEGSSTRKGVYQCRSCREQYTVTVGTIFEDSHLPLHKWLLAIHLMCSSKKGISALQLQRNLELGSYRTAWFMGHRIRLAMTQEPMAAMLKGVVEVDETYVGGREKGRGSGSHMRKDSKKVPVVALVERGGDVRSFPVPRVTLNNIKPILKAHIDPSTHLMTDEHTVYYFINDDFPKHHTIRHKDKEYVRREAEIKVTTNTVESYFSLLKRANYGIYHHWSEKYIGQYCAEVDFRYNGRRLTDDERTRKAIRQCEGKRLMLKKPKGAE